jgi:cytochrome c oxidase cbb3-type subunit I/II
VGAVIALYNLWRTAAAGVFIAEERAEAPPLAPARAAAGGAWHRGLEARPAQFAVLVLVSVVIGGVVEYVPTAIVRANVPTIAAVRPYTPLELEGRDLYIREGCVGCHSQMVRPIRAETERYGEYSKPGEFVYDHPFLWGSKRTGPDLHRVGGKYPDSWHFLHMRTPEATSPGSIMPGYDWLYDAALDRSHIEGKIITLRRLGVPYPDGYERQAGADLQAQAERMAADLTAAGFQTAADREIIAMIAYLQRLGTDIKAPPETAALAPAGGGR